MNFFYCQFKVTITIFQFKNIIVKQQYILFFTNFTKINFLLIILYKQQEDFEIKSQANKGE